MNDSHILRKICNRFRSRLRRLLVEYALLQTVFFCLATAAILVFLDWRFRFNPDLRLISLLTVLAIAGLGYWFGIRRPLRRSWSDDEVLGYLDRASDERNDALTALRDLSQPENMREWDTEQGKQMVGSVLAEIEPQVQKVDVGKTFRTGSILRWRRLAAVIAALYLIGLIVPRDSKSGSSYLSIGLRRILLPYAAIFWPQKTRLFVQEPETGWRVAEGEPLHVKVDIDGEVPHVVNIVYQTESGSRWLTERMAVMRDTAQASFSFGEMNEAMTFFCEGGDDRERRRYSVTVARRPYIEEIKATYTYPAYTFLPKRTVPSGQLTGLEGTEVNLAFTASAPLSKATITFAHVGEKPQDPIPVENLSGKNFSYGFQLAKSGIYTIDIEDMESLKNGVAHRYEMRVDPDMPPEITLEEPLRDMILTAQGRIRVKFKAEDDFGLTDLSVMLAPEGGEGQALPNRLTGDFWDPTRAMRKIGEGEFDLDFLTETEKGTFKHLPIQDNVDLSFWIRAVDCNPVNPGISETVRIRLSILKPTEFMDTVVLLARDLMNDARIGWFNAAGALHDGQKWLGNTSNDDLIEEALAQQQTAERAAAALAARFPELLNHMHRNRMFDLFMGRRLERVAGDINELGVTLPNIGKTIEEGKPASAEENEATARRQKMAKAFQSVTPDLNRSAWRMRMLYNHIADWVALQGVLLQTRRMEEMQQEINVGTDGLVKKTLGREARDLDDDEVRVMKELAHRQRTVHEMDEAVEKQLSELILQAERDGRRRVWEALAQAFRSLRDNRIEDKLRRAAMAINDARGETIRKDQDLVLEVLAVVNRGLIAAGEEVPGDPPDTLLASQIDDPRDKEDIEEKVADAAAEAMDDNLYERLGQLDTLAEAKADSLDQTLEHVFRNQEDVRNRTAHVLDRGAMFPRYIFLRTGLTSHRQGHIVDLLKKAVSQVPNYGKIEPTKPQDDDDKDAAAKPMEPDPALDRHRERLSKQINDYLAGAGNARALLNESDFSRFVSGIQNHVHKGAEDMRFFIQGVERLHGTYTDRKNSAFLDPFERPYLFREDNLAVMIDATKNLQWALAQQNAAQRETEWLGQTAAMKDISPAARKTAARIEAGARSKNKEVLELVTGFVADITEKIQDPEDPERQNERVKHILAERVLAPLNVEAFQNAVARFDRKEYATLTAQQEELRRALSSSLVASRDLFNDVVPPKTVEFVPDGPGLMESPDGYIIYTDEMPKQLAERIESEGAWLDEILGGPEQRQALVERLRSMDDWDPRYARLQSAYFQALAQHFQARAQKQQDTKTKDK